MPSRIFYGARVYVPNKVFKFLQCPVDLKFRMALFLSILLVARFKLVKSEIAFIVFILVLKFCFRTLCILVYFNFVERNECSFIMMKVGVIKI